GGSARLSLRWREQPPPQPSPNLGEGVDRVGPRRSVHQLPGAVGLAAGGARAALGLAVGGDAGLGGRAPAAGGLVGLGRGGVAAGTVLRVGPGRGLAVLVVIQGIVGGAVGLLAVALVQVVADAIADQAADQRARADRPPVAVAGRGAD